MPKRDAIVQRKLSQTYYEELLRDWYKYIDKSIQNIQTAIMDRLAAGEQYFGGPFFRPGLNSTEFYQQLKDYLETERAAIAKMAETGELLNMAQDKVDSLSILEALETMEKPLVKDYSGLLWYMNEKTGRGPLEGLNSIITGTVFKQKELDPGIYEIWNEKWGSLDSVEKAIAGREQWLSEKATGLYRDAIIGKRYDWITQTEEIIHTGLMEGSSYSEVAQKLFEGPYREWRSRVKYPMGGTPKVREQLYNAHRAAWTELHAASQFNQNQFAKNDPDIIGTIFHNESPDCPICGEILPDEENEFYFSMGVSGPQLPPYHPNCMCYQSDVILRSFSGRKDFVIWEKYGKSRVYMNNVPGLGVGKHSRGSAYIENGQIYIWPPRGESWRSSGLDKNRIEQAVEDMIKEAGYDANKLSYDQDYFDRFMRVMRRDR